MDLASVACFGICIGSFPELRTYIAMGRTPFSPYLKLNKKLQYVLQKNTKWVVIISSLVVEIMMNEKRLFESLNLPWTE